MGNFYIVTKTIHGRQYLYWQRTKRVGKSVKTENKYIGPASGTSAFGASRADGIKSSIQALGVYHQRDDEKGVHDEEAYLRKRGISPDRAEHPNTATPYDITVQEHRALLDNMRPQPKEPEKQESERDYSLYSKEDMREVRAEERQRKQEYEKGMQIQKAAVRAVKRKTKGIKSVNAFLAQAIKPKE